METTNEDKEEELEMTIKRIGLIQELLQADSSEIVIGNTEYRTQSDILADIDDTFDGNQNSALTPVDDVSGTSSLPTTTNWQTSTQTKFNCAAISNDTGYNWGTLTGLDFNESYFVAVQGYPSFINILDNSYCTDKNFSHGYVKARNIAIGSTCTVDFSHSSDAESGYCVGIRVGSPVLITSNVWYDDWNLFSTTKGWTFFWVPE